MAFFNLQDVLQLRIVLYCIVLFKALFEFCRPQL